MPKCLLVSEINKKNHCLFLITVDKELNPYSLQIKNTYFIKNCFFYTKIFKVLLQKYIRINYSLIKLEYIRCSNDIYYSDNNNNNLTL